MTDDFRADLHTHTYCSDGTDAPFILLEKAKQIGLQGLSITDHDTLDAYTPELFEYAQKLSIQLLSGIELSSEEAGASIHLLGYHVDIGSKRLHSFLKEMIVRRGERNRNILAKLKGLGLCIEEEELLASAAHLYPHRTIGRPHIAELMVQKGYVPTMQFAFERYLKEGALCFTPGIRFSPREAIEEIHLAGGKAVLAHPHFYKPGPLLKHLLTLPLDGIECYYGTMRKEQERPWLDLAAKHQLIATGGSDYHGAVKPHIALGCSWVGRETFQRLLKP